MSLACTSVVTSATMIFLLTESRLPLTKSIS